METLHILIRVSTSSQEVEHGGTSLITQKQQGIELSKKLNMKYQIHDEGGTSSSKDTLENRPVMLNLLRLMDEGLCTHLWVVNTDRISRGFTWYVIRKKMVDNGVILYTSNGRYDTSGSMETMILGILSEVSMYDSRLRIDRSRTGKIEKVKQNFYRGGDPPFGFRIKKEVRGSKLVIDEIESQYVTLVYTMYHQGHTVKEIKQVLEESNVKTRRGNKHWSLGTLQLMLRNDTYIGIDEFHDKKSGITIRNQIPSIIPVKLFEEVQQRRMKILTRKGQINRSTRKFLFRDYLFCGCGSPIGGRVKPLNSVEHYYCPLSERKFNKSQPFSKSCDMKRCVNISKTEELLWDSLLSILTRTTDLKEILQKSLLDKPSISSKLRKQKGKINLEIKNKQVELEKLINSIVEVEKNNLLNVYTSNNVYVELKYQLNKQFKKCKIELENLNNSLKYYSQRDTWFKTLESFSKLIKSTPIWDDKKKKEVLVHLLDKVILKHDPTTLLHTLDLHLRIPLILTPTKKGNTFRVPFKNLMKPLLNQVDQLCTVEDYSTVTLFAKFLGWSTLQPLIKAI
jgi:DNA invertase Pin-like site-specific DNA recombinase